MDPEYEFTFGWNAPSTKDIHMSPFDWRSWDEDAPKMKVSAPQAPVDQVLAKLKEKAEGAVAVPVEKKETKLASTDIKIKVDFQKGRYVICVPRHGVGPVAWVYREKENVKDDYGSWEWEEVTRSETNPFAATRYQTASDAFTVLEKLKEEKKWNTVSGGPFKSYNLDVAFVAKMPEEFVFERITKGMPEYNEQTMKTIKKKLSTDELEFLRDFAQGKIDIPL